MAQSILANESTSLPNTPGQLIQPDPSNWQAIQTKNCLPFSKKKKRVMMSDDTSPTADAAKRDSICDDSVFRTKNSITLETQQSLVLAIQPRGSNTVQANKPVGIQKLQVQLDQTFQHQQSNQNATKPSWLMSGASSARNRQSPTNYQSGQQNSNMLSWVDWQRALEQSDEAGPGGQCNIFQQLLSKQYVQVLQNERQRQQYQEPTEITAQVIAALKDPSIKNKAKFISKIVDGVPAKMSHTMNGSQLQNTVNNTQVSFFSTGRKSSKPRSRATTQRSMHRKGGRDIYSTVDEKSRHMYEPWYLVKQQGTTDSHNSKGRQCYPGEGDLTLSQTALQIQNKMIIPKKRTTKTGSFKIRMTHYMQEQMKKSVDKGCGSEDDVFSKDTNNNQEGSDENVDYIQTGLNYPMASKFKDGHSGEYAPTKVLVAIDKKGGSGLRAQNAIMRQKHFLMNKRHLLDKKEIDGHILSPLSEKQDNYDGKGMYPCEATTLLNGSEANRDASHNDTESPFLLSSNMKHRVNEGQVPSSQYSPLRKSKKSAVAETYGTPFLFNQLKEGLNVRRRMTASFDKTSPVNSQRLQGLSIREKQRAKIREAEKAVAENLDVETGEARAVDFQSFNDRSEEKPTVMRGASASPPDGGEINDISMLPNQDSLLSPSRPSPNTKAANLTTETPYLQSNDLMPKNTKQAAGEGGDIVSSPSSSENGSTVKAASQQIDKVNEKEGQDNQLNHADLLQTINNPGAFTIINPATTKNNGSVEKNSACDIQKVMAKSTVFSFNSVPDMYKEDSKNISAQNRICRAYFNASKHNAKARDDSIKKLQKNNLGIDKEDSCGAQGGSPSQIEGLVHAHAIFETRNSNGDLTVCSDDPKLSLRMAGSDAMVQADVGTSPMGSNFYDGASSSRIELMSNHPQHCAVNSTSLETFLSIPNESNTGTNFARTMPIKVTEGQQKIFLGNQSRQQASPRIDINQQTHQLPLNSPPLAPNGIIQQQHYQQQAMTAEQKIQHAHELHKISEGVFSSEQSCTSALASHLKPNYSQRPVTQSKPRNQQKVQQPRRMILLENGEPESPQIISIDSKGERQQQVMQGQPQPECLCKTESKHKLIQQQQQQQQQQQPGIEQLCRSDIFQPNNGRGAPQEQGFNQWAAENGARIHPECFMTQQIDEMNLEQLVQPDFIKRIGVTKNGETLQPQYLCGKKNQGKRKSKLDRRIECQQSRMQPPIQLTSGFRSPLPFPEATHFQPASTTTLPHHRNPLSPKPQGEDQPLNQLRLEKYHQRHDQRKSRLPPSFMKQKLHYQAFNDSQKKSIEGSDSFNQEDGSVNIMPMSDEERNAFDRGLATGTQAISASHNVNDSSIDFDINELQKLEQLKPPSRSNNLGQDQFRYAEAFFAQTPKAFNIGINNVDKAKDKPGLESFIPALKPGVHNRTSGIKELLKPSEQFTALSQPVSPLNGQLRQTYFVPFEGRDEVMQTARKSHQMGMNTTRNSLFGGFQLFTTGFDHQTRINSPTSHRESFVKISKKMNMTQDEPFYKTSLQQGFDMKNNSRYQSIQPHEPMQLLSLGKQVNLAKQNRRKQILSMENRRLCGQEDRLFNERLKMVNAKMTLTQLPRVRRSKGNRDASNLAFGTLNPLSITKLDTIDNATQPTDEQSLTPLSPMSVTQRQSLLRKKCTNPEDDRNEALRTLEQTPAFTENKVDEN